MSQKTIKRTIELNYQAKGIESIKKELEKIKPFSGSTDLFKNLSNEIAAFEEVLKLNDIEDVTPEFAKEFEDRYAAILKGFEKLRLEITKQVDAGAATEIEKVIGFLEEAEKTLRDRVRDLERFQKIYSVDDKGKITAETKKYQKETMDQAGENILVSGERMTSLKGAEIKRADTMVREFEPLIGILDQISNKSEFINKKIEEGTVLTQGEVVQLQEIINKARENGEIQDNFRITAREINENIEIRNRLEAEQQKIMKKHIGETLESMNKEIAAAEKVVEKHREKISALEKESSESKDLSDVQKEMAKVSRDSYATQTSLSIEAAEQAKKRSEIERENIKISREGNKVLKDKKVEVTGLTKQILNYSIVFNLLKRAYKETINTITELDKSLTEMTVVTTMTRKEAWSLIPAMEELAKQTGFTTTEVAGLTTEYLKQGRTLRDAIILAEAAAKAARISGISSSESVTYLTAAINGFSLAAKDAIDVSDRFAALAASSATSYEELAVGLSKFAAQAHVAGVSIDFALGMLAKGVETTREAPETIGTALKTVISRMRELTDLGKTLEDGMDVNRVEKALGQVGIDLRSANGQFRDMQDVLTEVGKSWDKFTNNQRAAVAVALAGTRQQSRLIAIMNDFDRTLELVQTSEEAAGATAAQHLEYMKGMEGAMAQLKTSWQQFITTLTDSELIIGTIRALSGAIGGVAEALDKMGFSGQTAMAVILAGAAALKLYTIVAKIKEKQEQKGAASTLFASFMQRRKNAAEKEGVVASLLFVVAEKIKAAATAVGTVATAGATVVTYGFKAAVDALIASMTFGLGPIIKWIIVGLTALIALLIGAKQHGEGTSSFFASFFESIKSIVGAVVSILKVLFNLFKNIIVYLLTPYIKNIKAFMKLLTWVLDFITVGFQIISNAIEAVILWVRNLGQQIKKALGPIGKFFDIVVNGFKSFIKSIDGAIKGLKNWVNSWKRDLDDAKKSYEELNEEIQKSVQENQAEAYNLGQKNKEIDKLIKQYEELNNKEIKTDEDIEALEELRESIKELDETFIKASGEVDVMRMLEVSEENKEKIRENLYENAEEVLRLARRDIEEFLKDQESINVLGALIGFDIREDTELSKMQEKALALSTKGMVEKYQSILSSEDEETRKNALKALETDTRDFLTEVEKLEKQFEIQDELNDRDSITNKLNAYKAALENLDSVGRESLARLLPEMEFAFRELNKHLQNDDFKEMMFELGFDGSTFEAISQALKDEGKDIGEFLNQVAKRQAELTRQGVGSSLAFSQALSEQASQFKEIENRVALYGIAAKKETREIAGEFDNLNSKLKRVNETQEKFLSGDMTHTELFEFLEDYQDLLDEEGIENFMLGRAGFGASLRKQLKDKEDEYRTHIKTLEAELKKATPEQRKELELQIAKHKILIKYSDELSKLTKRQYELNAAQEQYNRFKSAGIEHDELFLELLEAQILLGEEEVRNSQQRILDLNKELQENYGEGYEQYFKVINGVFIWNYDLLKQHGKTANQQLRQDYQEALDTTLNHFDSIQKIVLERAKALADKKRKIYEDYFAALDKLEEKRERKQTREQLVKQLQRLEGATDEMSRKKAKELRKELNELDKEGAKKSQEESRKAFLEGINQALKDLKDKYNEIYKDLIKSGERSGEAFINALREAGLTWGISKGDGGSSVGSVGGGSVGGGGGGGRVEFAALKYYSKGGLVDYTGLANVHGSRFEPEAFLNVEQTKLFAQLRDNLVSSGGTSNAINIQNITIQTNELNNQQDFARAGDVLAEAFGKAISARGISVNTKR